MVPASSERADERYRDLDLWPNSEIAAAILSSQREALRAVEPALEVLAAAADVLASRLREGGRMAYAGAGSSGLIARIDALELPGTYGIAPDRVPVILAGGPDSLHALPAGAEDDAAAGEAAVEALDLGAADALIAVAASGATPFTLAALRAAAARGAVTVGIACVRGAPLLGESRFPVLIETPPEVVAGSTRMAAGTAQKCALNMLSTAVAVRLGHGYAGLMVAMSADNLKLRRRAVGIVARAAGVTPARAEAALEAARGSIKVAVVACAAAVGAEEARAWLERHGGDIRAALARDARTVVKRDTTA